MIFKKVAWHRSLFTTGDVPAGLQWADALTESAEPARTTVSSKHDFGQTADPVVRVPQLYL
jgi:hypothetical protein